MMTIFKYKIPVVDSFELELPVNAEILSLQTQTDAPCMWAKVNPSLAVERRHFRVYGTGNPIDQDGKYIGTFQIADGKLVFHVFEV